MGSTGSGNFSDYTGSTNSGSNNSGGNNFGGGASGSDRCKQAFNCILEEVAQCDFYTTNKTVPAVNTELYIALKSRLFAVDSNGNTIGALPTSYNYLAACLADGIEYIGVITASSSSPIPTITADFTVK